MARSPAWAQVTDLAEEQWGLFTRRQAEDAGMAWSTLSRLTAAGILERAARGVYRLRGAPEADDLALRAAWLQLSPSEPAWDRDDSTGVVSHRSAAALYGLGHLPADLHEFTLPARHQSRRPDVRVHHRRLRPTEWTRVDGLPTTRPARIAADLLQDREDSEAIAQVISDALRGGRDQPGEIARVIAPYATRHGFRRNDGQALLAWLLDLAADPRRQTWLDEALESGPADSPDEAVS